MRVTITPCNKLLPEQVNMDDMKDFIRHLGEEYVEVNSAWKELQESPGDGKSQEHLGEELVDLMTMCMTVLTAMEKMDGVPHQFIDAVTDKVFLKNYARGYHDEPIG